MKSIFFESSQYFLRYLTDLFTDLITRLPKQEQLTSKTPMPTGITKQIFWEYFDIQKFICEKIKISQEQFSQCMRGKRKFQVICGV